MTASPARSPTKRRYSQIVLAQVEDEVIQLRRQYRSLQRQCSDIRRALARELTTSSKDKRLRARIGASSRSLQDDDAIKDDAEMYYRLAGRTLFKLRQGHIGVRLETFHDGKYYESYYIIFRRDTLQSRLQPYKHNIPHFVPVQDLMSKTLDSNTESFFQLLDDYLQSYVARREAIKTLSNATDLTSCVVSNAVDYVCLKWSQLLPNSVRADFTAYVIFDDLRSVIPSKVAVVQTGESQHEARRFEHLLRSKPLNVALTRLI